jgi:biotin carboxylase
MAGSAPGRGSRILIVEPMGVGLLLVTQARELGFDVVVATFDGDDRILPDAAKKQAELVLVDTNDEPALTAIVLEMHATKPFAGIIPGFEFYVDAVARLADLLGVPGLPAATVIGLRDKAVMRTKVRAAGLRVPRYAEASTAEELLAATAHVGFPAVLKPATSAGSVHVSRVDDVEQVAERYEWMAVDTRTDLGRSLDGRVMLEEYLDGPEVSVEGYVVDDNVVIVSVTAKLLGPEPYFVEVGHIAQRDLDPPVRDAVESYVVAVCRTLGVTLGPFHCELRLVDDEPVLIEIGARLPWSSW